MPLSSSYPYDAEPWLLLNFKNFLAGRLTATRAERQNSDVRQSCPQSYRTLNCDNRSIRTCNLSACLSTQKRLRDFPQSHSTIRSRRQELPSRRSGVSEPPCPTEPSCDATISPAWPSSETSRSQLRAHPNPACAIALLLRINGP